MALSKSPSEPAPEPEPRRALHERALTWLLHRYFRLSRGMTLGVRAAVFDAAGQVFLVRHTYTAGWHLPGGGVEVGETLEEALAKELREEAMIRLAGPVALHGVFFNRRMSMRDHVAVFVVRDFVVDGVKPPDREIAEARFFPLDALPEGLTPGTRRRLAEILDNQRPSEEW